MTILFKRYFCLFLRCTSLLNEFVATKKCQIVIYFFFFFFSLAQTMCFNSRYKNNIAFWYHPSQVNFYRGISSPRGLDKHFPKMQCSMTSTAVSFWLEIKNSPNWCALENPVKDDLSTTLNFILLEKFLTPFYDSLEKISKIMIHSRLHEPAFN